MLKRFNIILFLLLLLMNQKLLGQQLSKKNLSFRVDATHGFVLPEYQHFNYLVNKPVQGLEVSLTKAATGKNYWEQLYKYPEIGLALSYSTLGNDKVFGSELGLFPYAQIAFIRRPKFLFTNLFGLGIGYATKKFDLENNYENISVGSHFNVHFNFKLGTKWMLSKVLAINSGLSFTHYSNANMAEPNLGVNLLTAFAGISYSPLPIGDLHTIQLDAHKIKNELAFIYSVGGKHTRALQSTVYFTSSISGEYKYHLKRKFHIGGGIDLSYDTATEVEMSSPGKSDYRSIYDFRTGFHFSQEIVYDRFSFILQEGIYLGLVDRVNNNFMYNRVILRWKFNDHFLVHASMRSYLHILDYPELGFGYYFLKSK